MLGIPEGRVGGAQQLHRPAGGVLRGDQVDALLLPPQVVFSGPAEEIGSVSGPVAGTGSRGQIVQAVENGPGKGWGIHPHVIGGDDSLQPLAPDVYLHLVVFQHVAVDVAQADGPLGRFVQYDRLQALALSPVVGNHGAAGDQRSGGHPGSGHPGRMTPRYSRVMG